MSNEKEEFEDWWELFELHCLSSDETIKIIEIVESAWNHQAKKLEEKDKLIEELEMNMADYRHKWSYQVERSANLEAQNAELREALGFYASPNNWQNWHVDKEGVRYSHIQMDREDEYSVSGELARKTLAKYSEKGGKGERKIKSMD